VLLKLLTLSATITKIPITGRKDSAPGRNLARRFGEYTEIEYPCDPMRIENRDDIKNKRIPITTC